MMHINDYIVMCNGIKLNVRFWDVDPTLKLDFKTYCSIL